MNTNKHGRIPLHAESLKIAIAREYLTTNQGYGTLAKKHGLSPNTVRYFVQWYKDHYPDPGLVPDQPPVVVSQTAQTRELEKQLKQANLKIAGLEMLISIAQKELGIDIVKKPGTKQS